MKLNQILWHIKVFLLEGKIDWKFLCECKTKDILLNINIPSRQFNLSNFHTRLPDWKCSKVAKCWPIAFKYSPRQILIYVLWALCPLCAGVVCPSMKSKYEIRNPERNPLTFFKLTALDSLGWLSCSETSISDCKGGWGGNWQADKVFPGFCQPPAAFPFLSEAHKRGHTIGQQLLRLSPVIQPIAVVCGCWLLHIGHRRGVLPHPQPSCGCSPATFPLTCGDIFSHQSKKSPNWFALWSWSLPNPGQWPPKHNLLTGHSRSVSHLWPHRMSGCSTCTSAPDLCPWISMQMARLWRKLRLYFFNY